MAKVTLEDNEPNAVIDLPKVCMRCGADATHIRSTTFWWHPNWIGYILLLSVLAGLIFLPIAILLALILHKTKTVAVPLCDRHRNPWLAKRVVTWGGLALFFLLLGAVVTTATLGRNVPGEPLGLLTVLLIIAATVWLPMWLVAAAIVGQGAIHAAAMGDRFIRLVGVSGKFTDAIEDEYEDRRSSRRYRDVEDDYRPSRRRRDEDDERYSDRRER